MDRRGVDVDSSVIAKNWASIVFHGVSLEALQNPIKHIGFLITSI